jgi:hypothetical protein
MTTMTDTPADVAEALTRVDFDCPSAGLTIRAHIADLNLRLAGAQNRAMVDADLIGTLITKNEPLQSQLAAQRERDGRDAGIWRWVSERAWFVDAAAYAFDLTGTRWEPKDYDADDIKDAIVAAMAEDGQEEHP